MEKKELRVFVWHDCSRMGCLIKGIQNYINWNYRDWEKIVFLSGVGENIDSGNLVYLTRTLKDTDIVISSCDSFLPTLNWAALKRILKDKLLIVVHKACEDDVDSLFQKSVTYQWLRFKCKKTTFISESHLIEMINKVRKSKTPRLDS